VPALRIWAYVISWEGNEDLARAIASSLDGHVDRLVVIYSNAAGTPASGPGEWIQSPNSDYYAEKFATTVSHFDGDVMLQVHADARCDDWAALARRCREVFETRSRVGVWQPETSGAAVPSSMSVLAERLVRDSPDGSLREALATENIVWALARSVCDRFRGHDLSLDHYGWGTVSAVTAVTHANLLDVVIDATVSVDHTPGSSYDSDAADVAQFAFARAFLDPLEFRMWQLTGAALTAARERQRADDQRDARSEELERLRRRLGPLRRARDAARSAAGVIRRGPAA
jgi:hypothetical protein